MRFDQDGEFYGKYTDVGQTPSKFTNFLRGYDIITQYTMFGPLDIIGVAERRNKTFFDMVKSMLSNFKLSHSLWREAFKIVTY